MAQSYPYPRLAEDGYDLEVIEQTDAMNHAFLRSPVPSDEQRFAVLPGDTVKLIFRYRDAVEKNGQTYTGEHMWVRITSQGDGCLIGTLDSSPQFTTILKPDQEIRFHPKHIIRIWTDESPMT